MGANDATEYADSGNDRVSFGKNDMPREWAEFMLRNWCERDPARFGAALAEAATGVPPKITRKR